MNFFRKRLIAAAAVISAGWLIGYELIWQWRFCHVYVEQGHSLILRYKGPLVPWLSGEVPTAEAGRLARTDADGNPLEAGILDQMRGPGRHFLSPFHYERIIVEDVVIPAGKVGIVNSKLGDALSAGEILVTEPLGRVRHKGVLRDVLGPGRYRIHTIAYEVKLADALDIPSGSVGVVTQKAGPEKGIREKVLPAGKYFINPHEQRVDVVNVGFWATEVSLPAQAGNGRSGQDEDRGAAGGISFPSEDGFPISLDATCIWGFHPKNAHKIVARYGGNDAPGTPNAKRTVDKIEATFVLPQINSVCRIQGSAMRAEQLVVGETREAFQRKFTEELHKVCGTEHLELQEALIRHIHAPLAVRRPIQNSHIAEEDRKTRDEQQKTARMEATLEEAKQKVILDEKRIDAETEKEAAGALASGRSKVEQIKAETERLMAGIDANTAQEKAEAERTLGAAKARVETMVREAEADRLKQAVGAFKTGEAYNRWIFATGLPDKMELRLFFAGPGTFWTDLAGFQEKLLGRLAAEKK